jgi:hypothetical protein
LPFLIEADVFDDFDVAAAAGEEDVEHGQRAAERVALAERSFFMSGGDEEAEAERRR